jgi:hypothetical protein
MRTRELITLSLGMLMGFLAAGCEAGNDPFKQWHAEQKYADYVPPAAVSLAKGKGVIMCTTPSQGMLYLTDNDNLVMVQETKKPKLLGAGLIPKNTEVTFDPAQARVWAKGGKGFKINEIDPTHTFEFKFKASE